MASRFSRALTHIFIATIILSFAFELHPQEKENERLRMFFWNVENLFDTDDDSMTDDNEFLPDGVRKWNEQKYIAKLKSLSKVILAGGTSHPPEIAGFCEVENRKVIEDLLSLTPLAGKYSCEIVHKDSDDPRGIDVCLIYSVKHLKLLKYSYLYPVSFYEKGIRTREVLYTKWLVMNDTLHLFFNHWPSRRGGVLATENLRIILAGMLREKGDSILRETHGNARIIFAGDFNCLPDGPEISLLLAPENGKQVYENLCTGAYHKGKGTYRFKGIWEMPDQIIVSTALVEGNSGIKTEKGLLKILDLQSLLVKDPVYPGFRPFSTYSGYRYQGGFSDHLPIILDLILPGYH